MGGSFRTYSLNSSGTIYTDSDGPIDYSEMGFYTQMQKKFELADQLDLKLTGSVRYDKSELFDGFLSPRLSAGFTLADNHNIRAYRVVLETQRHKIFISDWMSVVLFLLVAPVTTQNVMFANMV